MNTIKILRDKFVEDAVKEAAYNASIIKTPVTDAFFSRAEDTIENVIDLYDFFDGSALGTHSAFNATSRPMGRGELREARVKLPLFWHEMTFTPNDSPFKEAYAKFLTSSAVLYDSLDRRTREYMGTAALIDGAIMDPSGGGRLLHELDQRTKPSVNISRANFIQARQALRREADKIRSAGETVYLLCEASTIEALEDAMIAMPDGGLKSLQESLSEIGITIIDLSAGFYPPDTPETNVSYLVPFQALLANPRPLQSKTVYGGMPQFGDPDRIIKTRRYGYTIKGEISLVVKFASSRAPVLFAIDRGETLLSFIP